MGAVAGLARAVAAGELHPVELVSNSLEAVEQHADLNALITVCAEEALARARAGVAGPLAGVPLLVKDVFDTAGVRSTAGSRLYADRVPRSWAGNLARPSPDTAVHLVLCPRLGVHEIPPGGVDELKIRVAFSAYTRAFSFLGWPAIAIGGVQFEARDETVLFAAGLAWERAYGPLD